MGLHLGGSSIIYMVILWVAVIFLAIWLLSLLFPKPRDPSGPEHPAKSDETVKSPLEILRQRYDRGEVSQKEYEQIRRDLMG